MALHYAYTAVFHTKILNTLRAADTAISAREIALQIGERTRRVSYALNDLERQRRVVSLLEPCRQPRWSLRYR